MLVKLKFLLKSIVQPMIRYVLSLRDAANKQQSLKITSEKEKSFKKLLTDAKASDRIVKVVGSNR